MGNCIRASRQVREYTEEEKMEQFQDYHHQEEKKEKMEDGFGEKSGVKVKIVLTKEELQWLMFEIKANEGRKLEDVLQQIERGREEKIRVRAWKPTLESIIESPEGLDIQRL